MSWSLLDATQCHSMVMMFSMNVVAVLGWVRGLRFSRRRISDATVRKKKVIIMLCSWRLLNATVRMDDDDGDDESSKVLGD